MENNNSQDTGKGQVFCSEDHITEAMTYSAPGPSQQPHVSDDNPAAGNTEIAQPFTYQHTAWGMKQECAEPSDSLRAQPILTDCLGRQVWNPSQVATFITFSAANGLSLEDPKNDIALEDLSFLLKSSTSDGNIRLLTPEGNTRLIPGVNIALISSAAPELADTFVDLPDSDKPISTVTAPTFAAAIGFLRGIYQKDIAFCEAMFDRPRSILLQVQVIHLAQRLRAVAVEVSVVELMRNELRAAARAVRPAIDICGAVRYVYTEMKDDNWLRSSIAEYLVKNFGPHMHFEGEALRQTAFGSPRFHRDLVQASFNDDFSSQYAHIIIHLKVCTHDAHKQPGLVPGTSNDFTCQFHLDAFEFAKQVAPSPQHLAIREKPQGKAPDFDQGQSKEAGLYEPHSIAFRPKMPLDPSQQQAFGNNSLCGSSGLGATFAHNSNPFTDLPIAQPEHAFPTFGQSPFDVSGSGGYEFPKIPVAGGNSSSKPSAFASLMRGTSVYSAPQETTEAMYVAQETHEPMSRNNSLIVEPSTSLILDDPTTANAQPVNTHIARNAESTPSSTLSISSIGDWEMLVEDEADEESADEESTESEWDTME